MRERERESEDSSKSHMRNPSFRIIYRMKFRIYYIFYGMHASSHKSHSPGEEVLTLCAQFTVGPRSIAASVKAIRSVYAISNKTYILQLSQFIYLLSVNFICSCAPVDLFRDLLDTRLHTKHTNFHAKRSHPLLTMKRAAAAQAASNKNPPKKNHRKIRDQINLIRFNWILIHEHNAECAIFHGIASARGTRQLWCTASSHTNVLVFCNCAILLGVFFFLASATNYAQAQLLCEPSPTHSHCKIAKLSPAARWMGIVQFYRCGASVTRAQHIS